jgi:hypothetical protein
VARIAFHPVEAAAVDGHNDSVHADQIVFAQLFRLVAVENSICVE